ncbi:MAG: amino acid efflux transporter [Candidatus Eremiobacteraeota bacterium]|jgi:amino acid transporter|nr:amino acid efflux transporter [Candidatus Eremiobacteraeota bacterium]
MADAERVEAYRTGAGARLRRQISLPHGIGLAASTVIGSGLLALPGLAIDRSGPYVALAGWAVTLALSLPLMLVFMRLTQRVADAGGLARYAALALGPAAGSAATFVIVATFALCIPVGTTMGGAYLQHMLGLPAWTVLPLTLALLALTTLVNLGGAKPSGVVNNLAVVSLVGLIAVLVALNADYVGVGARAAAQLAGGAVPVPAHALWGSCALLFWAFLGWENLSFGSEEYRGTNAGFVRTIYLLGFAVVAVLYAALALVSSGAALAGRSVDGVTGLLALVQGRPVQPLVYLLIGLVVVANVNAWVFAASRLLFAAGRNGDLPRALGMLSPRGVPVRSSLALFALCTVLTAAIALGILPLTVGVAIADQNFIVLYVAAIVAFARVDKTWSGRVLAVLAALSCAFLLSGFGAWLLFPAGLALVGYWNHWRRGAPRDGELAPFPVDR